MRIGLLVLAGEGHLNPSVALGRELQSCGHQVIFFSMVDTVAVGQAAGLKVVECAAQELPLGTVNRLMTSMAGGTPPWKMSAMMKEVEWINTANLLAVDAWMNQHSGQLDCLLIDALTPHFYLLGEKHYIPYIILEPSIPAFLYSPDIPPTMLGFDYSNSWFGKIRDRITNALFAKVIGPFFSTVQNYYAQAWNLPQSQGLGDSRQALARLSQVPSAFDFPRQDKDKYVYTGPWVNASARVRVDFPWTRLNGKPLIYAALGTVYNDQTTAYQMIAQTCQELECQLVLAVGPHMTDETLKALQQQHPQFLFVRKAPQVELLQRTKLFITHAGMNSTLEALQAGVPMVAIPPGNDQPGVAARIRYHQLGITLPSKQLSVERLHRALTAVWNREIYTDNVQKFAHEIASKPGLTLAVTAIEKLITNHQR
ncbi:glycosyltransferase [Leptolyngbya sp. FACHB-261]|uniref:glycosyltransferase n=1 Tax=Leptolyngbya sp. FACHB-261 TaxID=2692806 RepID=UPI00168345A8|nr:glycosyltransferase [Leptolyngbya sp. FACHB-261]MBD2099987.1 glycosyltransferase family 1 protein [Leptolyngbya sp. FACHB-261]